jgi:predicted DNA-binding transcriptional regulator AlpA
MATTLYAGFSSTHLLTLRQVKARTGLSRIKIDALVQAGTFHKFSGNSNEVAYMGTQVDEWIDTQIARDYSEIQRRAYIHLVVKAVAEHDQNIKFCAASLFLKRSMLEPSGKLRTLSRTEVSEILHRLLSTSLALIDGNVDEDHKIRRLCFPMLNRIEGGGWRIDFLLEIPAFIEGRDFVEQAMTLWRKNVWSTDTWIVEVLAGRDEIYNWINGEDVLIHDGTVDHPNLYIPHDALYALSPPTVVDWE